MEATQPARPPARPLVYESRQGFVDGQRQQVSELKVTIYGQTPPILESSLADLRYFWF